MFASEEDIYPSEIVPIVPKSDKLSLSLFLHIQQRHCFPQVYLFQNIFQFETTQLAASESSK